MRLSNVCDDIISEINKYITSFDIIDKIIKASHMSKQGILILTCKNISNDAIKTFTSLQTLNCSCCENINNNAFEHLYKH